jgi:hypothetical protein
MKKLITALLLLLGFSLAAQQISNLKPVKHKYYADLPSASGVELYQNKIYLVADDLPWLFELNNNWQVINKYQISGITKTENGRTPKKIKADFEAMALLKSENEDYMLILSSGSKKVTRDTAWLFSLKTKTTAFKKNLRPWYDAVKRQAGITAGDEINIEGVAIGNGNIYVVHRGNVSGNFIAVSSLKNFLSYFKGKTALPPEVKIYQFTLPSQKGVTAGLSGACTLPGNNGLIITASLEATGDVINDGTVLGSYLGYIPFGEMNKGTVNLTVINDANGKILAKKQEGVVLINTVKNSYSLLTVCDNDDGSSDIYQFTLTIK